MVSSDKNGEHGSLLGAIVILVECLHVTVLGRYCHTVQVSTVSACLVWREGGREGGREGEKRRWKGREGRRESGDREGG